MFFFGLDGCNLLFVSELYNFSFALADQFIENEEHI
jgi:hypothetical protein